VLDWEPAAGAARYRFQVSASSTFGSLLYSGDTSATSATPPSELPLGTLYWRVAGIDAAQSVGGFSSPVQFTKTPAAGPR
jgi:hypothetical protein